MVSEVVEGLGGEQRDRVKVLRQAGEFFWIDVSLGTASSRDLGEALGIPENVMTELLSFGHAHPSARKFVADGQRVAFGIAGYLESDEPRAGAGGYHLRPVEVGVLVSADYLLTVHRERFSLPRLLEPYMPEGRSEQYAVYAVLDAIVASAFDALNEVDETLDGLAVMSTDLRAGRLRMATLRATSSRLSDQRRQAAPLRGLFERIGVEITRIEGLEADDEHYFERIGNQIHRLVDAIDAAADAMARLIDLRLNETSYWLTVVATIFLPLTFITGFFGMNFGWMVEHVDTGLAFWALGVGSLVVGVGLIWGLVVRGSPVQGGDDGADAARRP
jgi:magnesium transporter